MVPNSQTTSLSLVREKCHIIPRSSRLTPRGKSSPLCRACARKSINSCNRGLRAESSPPFLFRPEIRQSNHTSSRIALPRGKYANHARAVNHVRSSSRVVSPSTSLIRTHFARHRSVNNPLSCYIIATIRGATTTPNRALHAILTGFFTYHARKNLRMSLCILSQNHRSPTDPRHIHHARKITTSQSSPHCIRIITSLTNHTLDHQKPRASFKMMNLPHRARKFQRVWSIYYRDHELPTHLFFVKFTSLPTCESATRLEHQTNKTKGPFSSYVRASGIDNQR